MSEKDKVIEGQVSIFDLLEKEPPNVESHFITWFIHDGVDFEIECRHEPLERKYRCCGEAALEDKSTFLESYDGKRAPLRDGYIETWWEGEGEDSELRWWYGKPFNEADQAPVSTR
jgi:hypothetical protein